MSVEKSYEYMMDSLRRIIEFVREISVEWWWFEQGKIPIIRVRKLEVNKNISFEYLPKRPVLDALRVIYSNFEQIKKLDPKNRVDYALKTAQDLYLVLQAISYVIDAHGLAEKIHEARERIAKINPEALDEFIDLANSVIQRIRELLALNVFSWPSKRKEIEEEIKKVLKFAETMSIQEKAKEEVSA